jgi:plastocyanin
MAFMIAPSHALARASVLSLLLASIACSGSGPEPDAPAIPAEAPAPAPADESGPPSVVGKAPAARSGIPSIVILEPVGEMTFPEQAGPPVMDQISMTFIPATLIVRTGEPAEFRNSDDVLHNVRVREEATKEPAFNVAIPTGGVYTHTFERPGFYDVGCDIHPGMAAVVVAAESPYAVIADAEGNFVIPNVLPGSYKAVIYAGADKIERPLDVRMGRTELAVGVP